MATTLFELLLRVAFVLIVAIVAVTVMRRSSASLRALLLTATLSGALVLPWIALTAPRLELEVLPAQNARPAPVVVVSNNAPDVAQRSSKMQLTPPPIMANTSEALRSTDAEYPRQHDSAPLVTDKQTLTERASDMFPPFTTRNLITTLFAAVWIIGAALFLLRLALSYRGLGQLAKSAGNASSEWHATVEGVCSELKISRPIAVRVSQDIDIPAVAGVMHSVLLLPASPEWSAAERRDVALHELAHVVRWDALAQLLSNVACATYWFIPLTWHAARQAAQLREQACDNLVLRSGTRPSVYAQRLLTFSNATMTTTFDHAALAMARPANIQRRVVGILATNTRRTQLGAGFTTMFVAASLAVIGLIGVVEPVSASELPRAERTRTVPLFIEPNAAVNRNTPISRREEAVPSLSSAPVTPAATGVIATNETPALPETSASPAAESTTADVAPMVVVNAASQQQTPGICRGGTDSHSINTNDNGHSRTLKLTAKGPGCELTLRIEGKPTFNREFTDIVGIDGRGIFEIDLRENGVRHELLLRDDNGRISRTFRVDGRERPYDAEAAAWFSQILIAVDRQTAFAVDIRLPMLLERGGVNAVLAETGQMPSDYARTTYYKALSAARKLTTQELAGVMNQGAQLSTSDYYSSELLKGVGKQALADPTVRDGVMRLISRMESDYYKAESIKATLGADLSSAQLSELLSIAGKMESDYYIGETLGAVLARGPLDADKRFAYLTATRAIDSDYYRADAIGKLLSNGQPTNGEMDLLFTSISEIKSDTYMGSVLDRLLSARTLREADLLRAEVVARSIGSDNTQADVLRRIGNHPAATSAVRSAVLRSAESLSRYYREPVQQGVGR